MSTCRCGNLNSLDQMYRLIQYFHQSSVRLQFMKNLAAKSLYFCFFILSPSTNVILLSLYKLQTQVKLFADNMETLKHELLGLTCIFMFSNGKHENTSLSNYSSATTSPCLDILLIETTLEGIQIPNLKKNAIAL